MKNPDRVTLQCGEGAVFLPESGRYTLFDSWLFTICHEIFDILPPQCWFCRYKNGCPLVDSVRANRKEENF